MGRYVALSVVACSVLAQNYTDWTSVSSLNTNDTVTIDYNATTTPPTTTPNPLSSNLTINGTSTATITGTAPSGACGYVACWSNGATLSGTGTLTFTINGTGITTPAFLTKGNLTTQAGITVNGSGLPSTIFEAQNGANLAFNGNLTINGNANTTAIKTGTGSLTLGNGNKTVNITGNLVLGGSATINLKSGSRITGNITSSGNQTLTLANGSTITGNITQTGGNNFSLTMNGGTISGDVIIDSNANHTISNINGQNSSIKSINIQQGQDNTIYSYQNGTLTVESISMKGTNNTIRRDLTSSGGTGINLQVNGDLTLEATTKNHVIFRSGGVTGTLNTKGNTKLEINNTGTTINAINHQDNGTFEAQIWDGSQVTNGITTSANTPTVSINVNGTSQLNGTSNLNATQSATVKMVTSNNGGNTASGGTLNFSSASNTLSSESTNTLTGVSMVGANGGNATTNSITTTGTLNIGGDVTIQGGTNTLKTINTGNTLKITGSATLNGTQNTVTFENGGVGGTLTTSGTTTLEAKNGTTIGAIEHSNGDFTGTLSGTSKINGTSNIFTNGTASLTLNDTSGTGELNFKGNTNTLESKGTNNTTGGVSMVGANGGNATTNSITTTGTLNIGGDVTMQGGTNTLKTINTGNTLKITGSATLNGTQNTVTFENGGVGGTLTTSGTTTLEAKNGTTIGAIEHSGGDFTGTLSNQAKVIGTSNIFTTNNASLTLNDTSGTGAINFQGTNNTLESKNTNTTGGITMKGVNGGNNATNSITTDGSLTINGDVEMLGTTNTLQTNANATKLQINGNATLGNNATNTITFNDGGVRDTLTTNGTTTLEAKNGTTIGAIEHSGGDFTGTLSNQAKVIGTSNILTNGNAKVTLSESSGTGAINFQGTNNTLESKNTNTTGGITMKGVNGGNNATNSITTDNSLTIGGDVSMNGTTNTLKTQNGGTHLQINGNATLTATTSNEININGGGITGTLTTSGETKIDTSSTTTIGGGIRHSGGDFTANFEIASTVNGGITTSNGTNATITFKGQSNLNGDSTFSTTTNIFNLNSSSSVTGNLTFAGTTNTLTAEILTNITGQIITHTGTATYTFATQGQMGVGSTVTGGIDTHAGAGQTTATFNDASILQNGTSTLAANTDITFSDTSKAINEKFIINGGTTNITFEDNSQMDRGSVTNNGGTTNVKFTNDTKMTDAEIKTTSGTTTITADTNAALSNKITQSGGTMNATFSDNSTFTGNITQTNGTSDIKFQDTSSMTGNIDVTAGKTDILFTGTSKIKGNIQAAGATNNVTFTAGTLLDGNLTLDGYDTIMGHSKGDFTESHITGNVQGYDDVTLNLTKTQVDGYIHQGPSSNNSGIKGTLIDSLVSGGFQGSNSINTLTTKNSQIDKGVEQIMGKLTMTATTTVITGGFKGSQGSINSITMKQGSLAGGIKQDTGKLDFTSTDTPITGGFEGINSTNTLNLTNGSLGGGIKQSGGTLDFTSTNTPITGGFSGTNNSNNTLKMTGGSLADGIKQDTGTLSFTSTDTTVTGGFKGTSNSNNTVTMTKGSLAGGISQDTGTLEFTSTDTTVTGGFSGTNNSNNTVTMTGGSLSDGISQNTGTLDFLSMGTNLSGGFSGIDSTNTLMIANGDFGDGNISQTNGSLSAELINITQVGSFTGNNSTNIIHSSYSEFQNISQSQGSLEFVSNANVNGTITGTNSTNSISITGANVTGDISQTQGSMRLELGNAGVKNITASSTTFGLYATSVEIDGAVQLENSTSNGVSSQVHLTGAFTQNNGTSNFTFADALFDGDITLNNATNASLVFAKSTIQNVNTTQGTNYISLSNGEMKDFNGNGAKSLNTISLTTSKAGNFSQKAGQLTLNATSESELGSITGNSFSNLTISLDRSKMTGGISNNGPTAITTQQSEIAGNITQTGSMFTLNSTDSTIKGKYSQTDGSSSLSLMHSNLEGGIELTTLIQANLTFAQNSTLSNGIKAHNSAYTFQILSGSTLNGGLTQDQGGIGVGTIDSATFKDDINLSDGKTGISLFNNATLTGNITATDHQTTLLLDQSTLTGNITITRGSVEITLQNTSTLTSAQTIIQDADLKLTVDSNSTFNGNLSQTNNKQEIIIKQDSSFKGNITNKDTTSTISINHSRVEGNILQEGGTLTFDLSNQGILTGNLTLKDATTQISGSGRGNEIGGSLSQTNGTLTGEMNGLTLKGSFTQENGISNATFNNSAFLSPTTITNATSSSLTFNTSTLVNYTISGGTNNNLNLLNTSTMNGTLTLTHSSQTTLTMQDSTINGVAGAAGVATAISGDTDSTLSLNTTNSTITGAITFNTGGLKGNTSTTTITGDITLTNTTSDVSFTNTSTINGTLSGSEGDNTIKFDNSSITGDVSQTNGSMNLDLSNGSSIGGNLTFDNATATLVGIGAGNNITGNFTSTETTLSGDISGLTLVGTFTQEGGSSDIIFRDLSRFNGAVSISNATSSNLKFLNQSGIANTITITNGTNNAITLSEESFINGDMSLSGTLATLSAQANSSITGNTTSNNSDTTFSLTSSTLQGDFTQEGGTLRVGGSENSTLTSDFTITNGTTTITLNTNSNLIGNLEAQGSDVAFHLSNHSNFNSPDAQGTITLNQSSLAITANNGSSFNANITQRGAIARIDNKAEISFDSGSTFNGNIELSNIQTQMNFNQSTINSDSLSVDGGSLTFQMQSSPEGGVINNVTLSQTLADFSLNNSSNLTLATLTATGSTLSLQSHNNSRLTGEIRLDNVTSAQYNATSNGVLNINTTILNNGGNFEIDLNGGILQGTITQKLNGFGGYDNAELALSSDGEFGGRWAISEDSQVKSLKIDNANDIFFSNAIFSSVFESKLSFVDFTVEFEDTNTSSRIGKELIVKPIVPEGDPLPDAGFNQTYVRTLSLDTLGGNNGLFRVYADLGTQLADQIVANHASGEHLIQVYYRPDTFTEGFGGKIVVAKVKDSATQVSFKGTQSEVGLRRYNTEILKQNAPDGNGFEWVIGSATPTGMSYTSKVIASILQSQYRSFSVEIDSLDRRMGDLKYINRQLGIWARSYIGQSTQEATDFSTSTTNQYYSVWGGADFNSLGLSVHNYAGVFFNYTYMDTTNKDYLAKTSNIAFGFYNTFKAFSGFYADLLAKYIYTMSSYDISLYSLANNKPEIGTHNFLLNAEIGYSFYYGEKEKSGYIQPQFQVTSGYTDGISLDFIDVSGELIKGNISKNFPVSIRTGVFWGQVFGEKFKSHIKVGTSLVYDVNSGGDLDFKDSSTVMHFDQKGDLRWLLSAQTDFTFNDFFKLYASIDTSFFGNYNITYSANVGLRFSFGKSNNSVANVPMVYSPYTPPVIIDTTKRNIPTIEDYTIKDINQNYVGKPRQITNPLNTTNQNIQSPSMPSIELSRQPHRDITEIVEFGAQR